METISAGQSRLFFNNSTSTRNRNSHLSISSFRSHSVQIRRTRCFQTLALHRSEHDVVVVGAGIIGLTIARQFLLHSDLSVAVTDAHVPCSGATGAGQGYIWMAHKTPGTDTWDLAVRSKELWENLAESLEKKGSDPEDLLGWKKTGSLLVGTSSEEQATVQERVKILSQAGLRAKYLSFDELNFVEPELKVGTEAGAALVPDDCQIDAYQTVSSLQKVNNSFSSEGRYAEFFNDPSLLLMRSEKNGEIEAVQTNNNMLYAKKAIIIATGAWTGSLLPNLFKPDIVPQIPIKPRKGHLLVLENSRKMRLNHALMEVGYIGHQNTRTDLDATGDDQYSSSISFTATLDSRGNLVLGSSREFCGFNREIDRSIIKSIWDRAVDFFPILKNISLDEIQNQQIRIGHRPYMPDGKPVIGAVPNMHNVFVAAGHEGSGLSLALGTAEMMVDMILENPTKVDPTPFSIPGRFSGNFS